MKYHEFVLAEDNRLDLANSVNAVEWITARIWWPSEPRADGTRGKYWPGWPDGWKEKWCENITALRTVGRHLLRLRRVKPSTLSYIESRRVFQNYLSKCRVQLCDSPSARWEMETSYGRGVLLGAERLDEFWITVFWSILAGGDIPESIVCSRCGKPLRPKTKTGRRSKRQFCNSCTTARHVAKLTAIERRDIWRRVKRRQRRKS